MSDILAQTEVTIRENRLKSIIYYAGKASELARAEGTEKFVCKERSYSQCSDCAQMTASTITYFIRDAAVVVHSPMGCFANTPLYILLSLVVIVANEVALSYFHVPSIAPVTE